MPENIEVNEKFRVALDALEYGEKSLFITGRAGTGKSTLLEYFRNNTGKNIAVLAPTGVAALNVKGQTIHSFFHFKPGITPERVRKHHSNKGGDVYRGLDTIIIDEVSMVRADLMDCIDRFMRLNGRDENRAFGGVQMVFIGDLYQLPPIITSGEQEAFEAVYTTPYFYGARVFENYPVQYIELDKMYRQKDETFIEILNSVRENTVTDDMLSVLNSRYIADIEPEPGKMFVYLTTTNKGADDINQQRLVSLDERLKVFSGSIEGDFASDYLPNRMELGLKIGSQVMMLNNDANGRWVNGSIGRVVRFTKNSSGKDTISIKLSEGETVEVAQYTWEIFRYFLDGTSVRSETIGQFTQFPLMLAWAVTIHKGQGKTFDNVIIDIGRGTFAHGQLYVALSRCTTLGGIILKRPVLRKHIWTNYQVSEFLLKLKGGISTPDSKDQYLIDLIHDAIEKMIPLEITYVKPGGESSVRTVIPKSVGDMDFRGNHYLGMKAFCLIRKQVRTFRLDRITDIKK